MDNLKINMTVYFEEPFWVGVIERIVNGKLSVVKTTFGVEPKDYDLYRFILGYYYKLKFSPAVKTEIKEIKKNPKRIQRDVKKQVQDNGIGTKSQQALKLQQEQCKIERKHKSREQKEREELRMFELRQQKKKDKHKGR